MDVPDAAVPSEEGDARPEAEELSPCDRIAAEASACLDAEQYLDADAVLRAGLEVFPEEYGLWALRLTALGMARAYSEIILALRHMPPFLADTVLVQAWRAQACLRLGGAGRAQAALQRLESAELVSVAEVELVSGLLLQCMADSELRERVGPIARRLVCRTGEAYPTDATALSLVALWAYLLTENPEAAIPHLEHALAMEPWRHDLRSILAQRYVEAQRFSEFLQMMKQLSCVDELPGIYMEENLRTLSFLTFEHDLDEAAELGYHLSGNFVEQHNDLAGAHFAWGYFLEFLTDDTEKALEEMELATEMEPEREDMHKLLAQAYDRHGKEGDALRHWLRLPLCEVSSVQVVQRLVAHHRKTESVNAIRECRARLSELGGSNSKGRE